MTLESIKNQAEKFPWQDLYSAMVDATGAKAFVVDPQGRLVAASPLFCELVGEPLDQILKRPLSVLFPGSDLLHPPAGAGRLPPRTIRLNRPDGGQVEIQLDLRQLGGDWLFGLVVEKPAAQTHLSAQAALDHAPIAIFCLDADGVIVEANQEACLSLGYAPAELIGKTIFDIDPSFTPEAWRQHRQNLVTRGASVVETVHRRKDGSTFPIEVTVNYYQFQGKTYSYSFVRNLTEFKKAEEALKQSENRFRTLSEATFEGIALTREDIFLDFNDQLARMLGYTRTELLNTPVGNCVAPEDRQSLAEYILGEQLKPFEYFALRKDGSRFPAEIRARAILVDGREVRLTATRDITERKQAEQRLRESEERFSTAFHSSPAPMTITEIDTGRFIDVNEHWLQLLGLSYPEVIGRTSYELNIWADPAERDKVTNELRLKGSCKELPLTARHPSGEIRQILLSAELITLGGRSVMLSLVYDVTERQQAEQRLRESEERFSIAFHSSPAPMAISEIDTGRFIAVNEHCLQLLARSSEETIGHTSHELNIWIDPADREKIVSDMRLKGSCKELPLPIRNAYGEIRQTLFSAATITLGGRAVMLSLIYDVTERQQAEQRLRESEERFSKAFHSSPAPMVISEIDTGRLVVVNEHWLQLLGRSYEEVIGRTSHELNIWADPADRDKIVDELRLKGMCKDLPVGIRNAAGEIRQTLFSAESITLGGRTMMLSLLYDFTERRQAEQRLRESEERFSKAFHSNPAPMAITDFDSGRFIDANENCLQLLGYSYSQIVDHASQEMDIWVDDAEREQVLNIVRREGSCKNQPVRFRHSSGQVREILFSAETITLGGVDVMLSLAIDITERKQAEEAIEKSNEQIRAMFETSTEGITFADLSGSITQVNDAVIRMHEYSSQAELIGKSALVLIAPADHARALESMQATLQTGRSGLIEYKFITTNGRIFDAELNSVMLRDPQGRPSGFVAFTRDISQRKQMENALREANDNLTRAQRIAQLGSWEIYLPTRDVIWSAMMYQIMGLPAGQQMTIEKMVACYHPEDQPHLLANARASIEAGDSYNGDYRISRPGGQVRYVHDEGQLIRDDQGQPLWLIGTTQDITERKRTEILLQALNEAAIAMQRASAPRQIFTAVASELDKVGLSCAFFSLDASKENLSPVYLLLRNIKKAEKLTGLEASKFSIPVARVEVYHTVIHDRKTVYLSSLDEITRLVLSRPLAGVARLVNKYLGVSRSIIAPLIIDDEVIGMFSVQSDDLRESDMPTVTAFAHQVAAAWRKAQLFDQAHQEIAARREAEAQIRQLNEELEKRVADRTAELREANSELEAFAYSVSHDLRAPLRAINGYTSILVEDHGESLDDEGRRICSVISGESRRMGQLIDDLLAFSRMSRVEMQVFPVDMNELARSVYENLVTPDEKQRIQFRLDPLPKVEADSTLIRQVWINLLSNAIKFTRKIPQPIIHVGGSLGPREATFFVRDNGAGFDMRYAGKLFGVFQRLHSESQFEGTGVGLAIVQRVISRHGGRVWADGTIDQGATFSFSLPRARSK